MDNVRQCLDVTEENFPAALVVGDNHDSDELDTDDEMREKEVNAAREYVEKNPHVYEAHETLVRILRLEDLVAVREARENFAAHFPLSPLVWLDWIKDESRIAANAHERARLATEIYPRALADYVSVNVAQCYLQFQCERRRREEINDTDLASSFERLVVPGAAGLVFPDGISIWRTYRAELEALGASRNKRVMLLARQMSIPLSGNNEESASDLFEDALAVCANIDGNVKEISEVCELFEEKLLRSGSRTGDFSGVRSDELVMQYSSYAASEEARNPESAKVVWERCISECFLHPSVWSLYVNYCQRSLSTAECLTVLKRAVRNVPWDLQLWILLLETTEKSWNRMSSNSMDELKDLVSSAAPHVTQTKDSFSAAKLARLIVQIYFRASGGTSAFTPECGVVQTALSFVESGSVLWAELQGLVACLSTNIDVSLRLMEEIVSVRPGESRWWIVYANLSREDHLARELLRRGLGLVSDRHETQVIGNAWLFLEARCARTNPTGIEDAYDAIDRKLIALGTYSAVTEPSRTVVRKRVPPLLTKSKRKRLKAAENTVRLESNVPGTISAHKAGNISKDASDPVAKGSEFEARVVYVNNLPYAVTTEQLQAAFEPAGSVLEVRLPRRIDGATKGFAYVEFEDDASVEAAIALHKLKICGREAWVRRSKPPKNKNSASETSRSSSPLPMLRSRVSRPAKPSPTPRMILSAARDHSSPQGQLPPALHESNESMEEDKNGSDADICENEKSINQAVQLRQNDFREMFLAKK